MSTFFCLFIRQVISGAGARFAPDAHGRATDLVDVVVVALDVVDEERSRVILDAIGSRFVHWRTAGHIAPNLGIT